MVDITVFLKSRHIGSPVTLQAGVDDQTLFESSLPVQRIDIKVDICDGPHVLWLKYSDKHPDNELREHDQLVMDTDVEIENISIDRSMMNYLKNDYGYVLPDWEYHAEVANWFQEHHGHVPEKFEKSSYLNLKSIYKFHFETPIDTFLQKHVTVHPVYAHMYNYPLEKYQELEHKILNRFKSTLEGK